MTLLYDPLELFLSEEELAIRDAVRDFARKELAPHMLTVEAGQKSILVYVLMLAEWDSSGLTLLRSSVVNLFRPWDAFW